MQTINYLTKLYFMYKAFKSEEYIISRLMLHDGSNRVICHSCRHFYVTTVNCKTFIIGNYFKIECFKCKETVSFRLKEDDEIENLYDFI